MKTETRYLHVSDLEVRALPDGGRQFSGYAIRYDEPSENLGGFVETCAPGLADQCLDSGADVRHLINHDSTLILGRTTAGTTRLERTAVGIRAVTDMPDTSYARDLAVSVERRDVTQMSFGFRVIPFEDGTPGDEWDTSSRPFRRTLRNIELDDVSTVTYPAYPTTTAEVRSFVRRHEGRAVGPALVAWDSEEGMCDYMADVTDSLVVPDDQWAYVSDVTTDGASALVVVCGEDGWQAYVAPVELGTDGEPAAVSFDQWVAVESAYVVADAERMLRQARELGHELRAGKAISAENADHIQAASDALDTVAGHLSALADAAELADDSADAIDPESSAEDEVIGDRSRVADYLYRVSALSDTYTTE